MDDWFSVIAADCELPSDVAWELHSIGFVVVPSPMIQPGLSEFVAAYDAAVLALISMTCRLAGRRRDVDDFAKSWP